MEARMEWAHHHFDKKAYSSFTKELHDMEIEFKKEVPDSLHWSRIFEYPWIYLNLRPFSRDEIVLDAGAGTTVLQFALSRRVKEVYSVDKNAEYVAWLNNVIREKSFCNVFPAVGDLTKMTFKTSFFDKTICISTLEHLSKQKVIDGIEELIRVTKPNGRIAITMDIVLEETAKQVDLGDFRKIAERYSFAIPEFFGDMMVFRVPPYNFPFGIACILMRV